MSTLKIDDLVMRILPSCEFGRRGRIVADHTSKGFAHQEGRVRVKWNDSGIRTWVAVHTVAVIAEKAPSEG